MRTLSVLLFAIATFSTSAFAQKDYVVIWTPTGPFTSSVEVGPGCTDSPIQMCTHGLLEGELAGTYEFSFDSIMPSPTPDKPDRIVYTGHSVITLENGIQLFGSDEGEMWGSDPFATPFITRVSVYDGDLFEGVSGIIVASGSIDFVSNYTTGTYESELAVLCSENNRNKTKHLCRALGPKAED